MTRVGRWLFTGAMASALAVGGLGAVAEAGGSAPVPSQLVVDDSASPSNLDPGLQYNPESYIVYRNIFDQLLSRKPGSGAVAPDIAVSWKAVNADTWRFVIRKGVKFTNGQPLTARDVAFSLQRIIDPAFSSPQLPNYASVSRVFASGDIVTIVTKRPSPTLLSFLTTLSIVPRAYVLQHGNAYFNLHPVGSGPYMLRAWVQGSKVVLGRNPHYWGRRPIFPSVVFRIVPNEATRVADLESGEADIALGITPDQIAIFRRDPQLKTFVTPTERAALLMFNPTQGPTKSLLVREAIAYAVDRPLLVRALELGYAHVINEPATPAVFGYDRKLSGFPYNPGKAKRLLQEAHYTGQLLVLPTSPVFPTTVVQEIQSELEAVGLNVKIQSYAFPTFLQKVQSPSHDWGNLRYGQWSCSCLDASGTIYPLFYSHSVWSSFSNPQFDRYITAAQSTLNPALRKQDLAKALTVLQQQVPGIGLWQTDSIYGANSHLVWRPDPTESFYINQMGWK